jgi:probable phosphoglycerate mutase
MSTPLIYVMRHGQSVVNVEQRLTCRQLEGDLTDLGREQARLAAGWLLDKGITAIRHSPFHRAEQTAHIVGERLGLVSQVDDDLREMDCGTLEGKIDADSWKAWKVVFDGWMAHDFRAAFPGGESFADGQARFARALGRTPLGENTLLVSHGGISRTVIPTLCVNAVALQRVGWLDNTGLVVLEPYDPGRYACQSWNLIDHLNDKSGD